MYLDIRKCGNNLVFRGEFCTLLELKVTYCTRQCKIAIDASEINESSCCLDSSLLSCKLSIFPPLLFGRLLTLILRLMVIGKWFCSALYAQNTSGIAGVGLRILAIVI